MMKNYWNLTDQAVDLEQQAVLEFAPIPGKPVQIVKTVVTHFDLLRSADIVRRGPTNPILGSLRTPEHTAQPARWSPRHHCSAAAPGYPSRPPSPGWPRPGSRGWCG